MGLVHLISLLYFSYFSSVFDNNLELKKSIRTSTEISSIRFCPKPNIPLMT